MAWLAPMLQYSAQQLSGGPLQADLPDKGDRERCQGNRETDEHNGGQQTHPLSAKEWAKNRHTGPAKVRSKSPLGDQALRGKA